MEVAIIGGGLTGLTAGYFLSKNGHQVVLFEKNNFLGGLAGTNKKNSWSWPVEFYVHHLFTSDKEILNLAKDLGIGEKVIFSRPKTSTFINGKISQFDSPLSILLSKDFGLIDKLRLGFVVLWLKLTNNWQKLEEKTADEWLNKIMGKKVHRLLWQPLLTNKFSSKHFDKISAAWFWSRIKKRGTLLGYFEESFQSLIEALAKKIVENGGVTILNHEVDKIEKNKEDQFLIFHQGKVYPKKFDRLIFTAPAPTLPKVMPSLPSDFVNNTGKLEMIGSLGLTLELEKEFFKDKTYWLNINDLSFPFVCVVEQTNFVDKKHYGGKTLLYISGYYPQDHPLFKMTKEEILKMFLPYLKKINSDFSFKKNSWSFLRRDWYSQPIIPTGYSKIIPPIVTPVEGLYFATMHHIYPWDRGTNYAVELGRKVADEIFKEK